ncbi:MULTISPECIES: tail protein X [unclassified Pseudomonas]|uniref:tail protein X n=1 Tax=unclassified Pseudomonas TaxID=196821 RepID=UPI002160EAAD|nr:MULTISPECIES: tail protein X [unclassified Pseudomonas]UVM52218.1 tail protein X [Pseudomonas sp. B21-015]WPN60427.1 tail protein X [Pseudomonas sp. P9_31]
MFILHVTTEGERWDQLAWRYYGDAHRYLLIVEANKHVPITAALPAGLTLAIPMLESVATTEDLPPWMR